MYYEINVSKDGRHFFATAKRSITSKEELKIKLQVIMEKFPEDEGYTVMVFYYPESGSTISVESILSEKKA